MGRLRYRRAPYVCQCGEKFADKFSYDFHYMARHQPEYRVV